MPRFEDDLGYRVRLYCVRLEGADNCTDNCSYHWRYRCSNLGSNCSASFHGTSRGHHFYGRIYDHWVEHPDVVHQVRKALACVLTARLARLRQILDNSVLSRLAYGRSAH